MTGNSALLCFFRNSFRLLNQKGKDRSASCKCRSHDCLGAQTEFYEGVIGGSTTGFQSRKWLYEPFRFPPNG